VCAFDFYNYRSNTERRSLALEPPDPAEGLILMLSPFSESARRMRLQIAGACASGILQAVAGLRTRRTAEVELGTAGCRSGTSRLNTEALLDPRAASKTRDLFYGSWLLSPRTECAGFVGITWPVTSQSKSIRITARLLLHRGRRVRCL
jgi:hypothetical protein